MNKICAAVKDNQQMFKPLKGLADLDYTMMIINEYTNDEINKTFDLWNKKYGNNIHFDDNDDTDRNNLGEVANEVKKELLSIEPDPDKVLDSLVMFLYSKPSTRKKKLLWYVFGDMLYARIKNKITDKGYCTKCGRRADKLINGWCELCTTSDGVKPVNCKTCGKEFYVSVTNNKTCYCNECKKEYRNTYMKQFMRNKTNLA